MEVVDGELESYDTDLAVWGLEALCEESRARISRIILTAEALVRGTSSCTSPRMRPNMAITNFDSWRLFHEAPVVYGGNSKRLDFSCIEDDVAANQHL